MADMDSVLIPNTFDYGSLKGLLSESRQKLERFRPRSLGQALRISGVTPADVQLLAVAVKKFRRLEGAPLSEDGGDETQNLP